MELNRITLPPITAPGEVTTFYSFESGTARSVALVEHGRAAGGAPERHRAGADDRLGYRGARPAPLFRPATSEQPGLLEYFQACRDQLALLGAQPAGADDDGAGAPGARSGRLGAYVERVDQSRPLYLMRAGRFDDSYGERADAHGLGRPVRRLPGPVPPLRRASWRASFRHVLVDCAQRPLGRRQHLHHAAAAQAGRPVHAQPAQPRGPGRRGQRAPSNTAAATRTSSARCWCIRCPAAIDSADCERRLQWRRGDPHTGMAGYQPRARTTAAQLLRPVAAVARQLSRRSPAAADRADGRRRASCRARAGARRRPLFAGAHLRGLARLGGATGRFPWQSRREIEPARRRRGRARAPAGRQPGTAPVARCRWRATCAAWASCTATAAGQLPGAATASRRAWRCASACWATTIADTRASRAALAGLLRDSGKLREARDLYELLVSATARACWAPTIPKRWPRAPALAATLAAAGRVRAPRSACTSTCIARLRARCTAPTTSLTLDSLRRPGAARWRAQRRDSPRAHAVRTGAGGPPAPARHRARRHPALRPAAGHAAVATWATWPMRASCRKAWCGARERQAGPDHPATVQAREALAEILAAQGESAACATLQEALATARERSLGSEHPDTLSVQLRLASTLGKQGELDAARRAAAARGQPARAPARRRRPADPAQQEDAGQDPVEPGPQRSTRAGSRKRWRRPADRQLALRAMAAGPHDVARAARCGICAAGQARRTRRQRWASTREHAGSTSWPSCSS